MQTKGVWQGILTLEEGTPKKVKVGSFTLNSIFHFMVGKRIILRVSINPVSGANQSELGELSTVGKLEYEEKKSQFLLEKYPLFDLLEGFDQKNVKIHLDLDQSVLSSRM